MASRVIIDGVEYIPKADVVIPDETQARKALKALLIGRYLYGHDLGRGWNGCIWDAMIALAPAIGEMDDYEADHMLDVLFPGWREED